MSKPQEEGFYSGELNNTTTATANNNNYVLMLDWSSIQFGNFLERRREDGKDEDVEKKVSCAVCWDCINRQHEMRDLCNCSHVFHRDCLDRWMDEGRVTCPLCRSMLRPPNNQSMDGTQKGGEIQNVRVLHIYRERKLIVRKLESYFGIVHVQDQVRRTILLKFNIIGLDDSWFGLRK